MAEVFSNPFTNTAASHLVQEQFPNLNLAQMEVSQNKAQTIISDKQLKESAKKLYEEMMTYAANVLFQSMPPNSIRKPVQRYSSTIKALTVCSLYLIAVENCIVRRPPSFLVSLLLEAMQVGDKIEQVPKGSDIIASYGSQSKAELIANVAAMSMGYVGCHSPETRKRVAENLGSGTQERFAMLQRTLEALKH